jgi:hypothetical protein
LRFGRSDVPVVDELVDPVMIESLTDIDKNCLARGNRIGRAVLNLVQTNIAVHSKQAVGI